MDERVAVITGGSSGIGADARARLLLAGGLDVRARRARRGAAARARRGDRRRGRGLRRRRPGSGRRARGTGHRAAPADQAARQQRGHPGAGGLRHRRRRSGSRTSIRVNYLGGVWCLRAFLPALEAAAPVGRRQRRLRRRHGRDPAVGAVRGLEARAARLLAGDRGAAPRARHPRPHGPARLRRDRGLPAARSCSRRRCEWTIIEPDRIARSILAAVEPRPARELRPAGCTAPSRSCRRSSRRSSHGCSPAASYGGPGAA